MILIIFFSILPLFSSAQNVSSTQCRNQTCGGFPVQYPFGFSSGCPIQLNCTVTTNGSSITEIAGFKVRNVTGATIFIDLPQECERPIENFSSLFDKNFAPTGRNYLLLSNCSSQTPSNCVIRPRLAGSVLQFQRCETRNNTNTTIHCYSGIEEMEGFLDYGKVTGSGNCSFMYSSVFVDYQIGSGNTSAISLESGRMELGWWINGSCSTGSCHPNATCSNVTEALGLNGHRCNCNTGYAGDGFTDGEGCSRVPQQCSNRSPWHIGQCGGPKLAILLGGVTGGGLLTTALIFICYNLKKRNTTLKSRMSAKRLLSDAAGSSSVPFYAFKEIERATNGFSEKQRLGTGAYGTVYSGKLHDDEFVAIKKIRYRDHESIDQVMNEIKLVSSVSHPNLVRLLGCCIENGVQILVYEYMANGTLSQHLQRERGSVLPWTIRLTIAAETARAIAHLHSINPPIYHRDIKSSNILLDHNFNSKVADFGLSRSGMMGDSHISTCPQGTPGYVDPQYHQNYHLSDKSDVYSFGVVLVEIISAMKVVDFSRPHTDINLAALAMDRIGKGLVDEIIDPYVEPNRDAWTLSSVHRVAELAFRCLAFHRDMRPSMIEVADELDQIKQSGWAPMEDNVMLGSSVASSCSSPYAESEKSFHMMKNTNNGISSRRLIVPKRVDDLSVTKEAKESPVSVQDPWYSAQSSPSTNSLLSNIVQ